MCCCALHMQKPQHSQAYFVWWQYSCRITGNWLNALTSTDKALLQVKKVHINPTSYSRCYCPHRTAAFALNCSLSHICCCCGLYVQGSYTFPLLQHKHWADIWKRFWDELHYLQPLELKGHKVSMIKTRWLWRKQSKMWTPVMVIKAFWPVHPCLGALSLVSWTCPFAGLCSLHQNFPKMCICI